MDIQLMKRCAAHVPVLYINSIVMRKPNIGEGPMFWRRVRRKSASILRGIRRGLDNFWVYSPLSLPVHHIEGMRELNRRLVREQVLRAMHALGMKRSLIWVVCPAACDIALSLPHAAVAYLRTDRYECYPGIDAEQIVRYDRTLKRRAEATFYANRRMTADEAPQCRRAVFLDHGVDFDRFATASRSPWRPPEVARIEQPIVGFFGDVDPHLVDVALLDEVVRRLPECRFVFVGTRSAGPLGFAARPNVTMVPQRPYEVIAHYGKCFDVAIMPWHENEWIDCCNPIKLKEYLALGKPVVSTPFSELRHYPGVVRVASGADAFVAAIREALADDTVEARQARRERVRDFSWESRLQLALESLAREGVTL